MIDGGYEDGYASSTCFWGETPSSYVVKLVESIPSLQGATILDAGCGEGKNAHYLNRQGAEVTAIDCSAKAPANARARWGSEHILWIEGDLRAMDLGTRCYDVVIAYGLLHCLDNQAEVESIAGALRRATRPGGYSVVCTFNSRSQDLSAAHRGFSPCLLPHSFFIGLYVDWRIQAASDEDLTETHPHNGITHTHSMTRIIAQRPR